jgi:hypothetical protein
VNYSASSHSTIEDTFVYPSSASTQSLSVVIFSSEYLGTGGKIVNFSLGSQSDLKIKMYFVIEGRDHGGARCISVSWTRDTLSAKFLEGARTLCRFEIINSRHLS